MFTEPFDAADMADMKEVKARLEERFRSAKS